MKKRMTKREANTYRRRLLKLATFLRALPRKRFDYNTWAGEDWRGMPDLSCGTTACALGWATTIPEFRRLGLRLKFNCASMAGIYCGPYSSTEAAMVPFGLNHLEADWLFTPGISHWEQNKDSPPAGATAKQVAVHIERFVRSWRPEDEDRPARAVGYQDLPW